jgi:hypothetical protein
MDSLTTCTHHSELQVITALSLISTLYRSPQNPLILLQPAVFTSRSLATASNTVILTVSLKLQHTWSLLFAAALLQLIPFFTAGLSTLNWTGCQVKVKVILRTTVSRPVCLGIKHPFGAYDQILIIVWQLWACWFGAPSLTRGRVCRLQFLLALASAVIFGSESRKTRGHILLSQIQDFPFRCLLRLAGSRLPQFPSL